MIPDSERRAIRRLIMGGMFAAFGLGALFGALLTVIP